MPVSGRNSPFPPPSAGLLQGFARCYDLFASSPAAANASGYNTDSSKASSKASSESANASAAPPPAPAGAFDILARVRGFHGLGARVKRWLFPSSSAPDAASPRARHTRAHPPTSSRPTPAAPPPPATGDEKALEVFLPLHYRYRKWYGGGTRGIGSE
jgi:hypothetical protein